MTSVALVSFHLPADHLAFLVAGELGVGQQVFCTEQPATHLLSTDNVLWKQGTLATQDQGDGRITQAERFGGLALATGPCDEVLEAVHGIARFAECQAALWTMLCALSSQFSSEQFQYTERHYAFRLTF